MPVHEARRRALDAGISRPLLWGVIDPGSAGMLATPMMLSATGGRRA
jgi:hypothetical protein